jgi:ectoine hydroxylase-related dioxygenase (phytanoyl-CoA dioxygenase family)
MNNLDRYKKDYNENGFISPVRIISSEEAKRHRGILENTEKILGNMHYQSKIHTILKSAYELATHQNVLDIVEKAIGPNILLHNTTYIIKEPQSPAFVSWHQDLTYWGFSHDDQISVWLALSNADEISGAMYMLPKSHLEGKKEHKTIENENNVLFQNQYVQEFDESKKTLCSLKPGEASFHHGWTIHSSMPNKSNDRRIGFNIQYIAAHVRQMKNNTDTAVCVRGIDNYNNFGIDVPAVSDELNPATVTKQKELNKKYKSIVSSRN